MMTQEQKDVLAWYNRTYGTSIDGADWGDRVNWSYISHSQSLSEGFIREFQDRVNWRGISRSQSLSEGFIREFSDRVDWSCISANQSLSEGFIREFSDRVDWRGISRYQSLSEGFIREFSGRVDWEYISRYQSLSEEFIREFSDRVDWGFISSYQSLSEGFIREFRDRVRWGCISRSQLLSEEFAKEFSDRIPSDFRQDNWLYADRATKLRHIREKAPEFETQEDEKGPFIVAYKSTLKGGRSNFKPSIRYEVGGIYKARCDHNMRQENSFGLSAWTREGAESHVPGGELYRVKIYVDDIGAMVHDGRKIRCKRQEFIERIK